MSLRCLILLRGRATRGVFGICQALGVKPPFPAFLLRTPVQNKARHRESVFGTDEK